MYGDQISSAPVELPPSPSTPKIAPTAWAEGWGPKEVYGRYAGSPPAMPQAPEHKQPTLGSPSTPPATREAAQPTTAEFHFSTPSTRPSNSQAFGSPTIQENLDNPFSSWRKPNAYPQPNQNYFHPTFSLPQQAQTAGGMFALPTSPPPTLCSANTATPQAE